jgi:COP9 signalosome complex subunit 3
MTDILQTLLAFPPDNKKQRLGAKEYDKEVTQYISQLKNIHPSSWTDPVEDQSILELLDPAVNSIAYLIALNKDIDANDKSDEQTETALAHALIFLTSCDPVQIRYVGDQWQQLFNWVISYYEHHGSDDLSGPVNILLRLDPSAGVFTPYHLRILRLALREGVPSQALPILDRNIYAYPHRTTKGVPEDLPCEEHELSNAYIHEKNGFLFKLEGKHAMEYYLLGAHVYIGLRNFSRARLFLEYVLLSPSQQHTPSALQVEAYKKWVVIGLLADGKQFPSPRTADALVWKNIRNCSKAYDALVDDFEKRDHRKFQADAEVGMQIWEEDGNLGLIQEALSALQRFRVIDLRKTYAALPVSRLAKKLDLALGEAHQLLQGMISGKHLYASLSGSGETSVLRFHTGTELANAEENDLEAQTSRIHNVIAHVRDADRRLQVSKEYIEHQKRNRRMAGGPDGDIADAMDLTFDGPPAPGLDDDGDEDIMGV